MRTYDAGLELHDSFDAAIEGGFAMKSSTGKKTVLVLACLLSGASLYPSTADAHSCRSRGPLTAAEIEQIRQLNIRENERQRARQAAQREYEAKLAAYEEQRRTFEAANPNWEEHQANYGKLYADYLLKAAEAERMRKLFEEDPKAYAAAIGWPTI